VVNFRFHLVSITAVFLALGIGILVGATVVDQGAVQLKDATIRDVTGERDSARTRVRELTDELEVWGAFAEQAQGELLAGRLADTPVLTIAVEGVEQRVVDAARQWMQAAGALDQGTVWLTTKLTLESESDVGALGSVLQSTGSSAPILRGEVVRRFIETFTAASGASLAGMRDTGFLRYDLASDGADIAAVPVAGTRVVVITPSRPDPTGLAIPLVRELSALPTVVLAAQASPTDEEQRGGPVELIRGSDVLRARIATIDDVDEFFGQVGLVLALDEATRDRIGHYGTGGGADGLLPPPRS
jgi:hypothetical protein